MRIDSLTNPRHYATLTDDPDGIAVAFWRLTGRGDGPLGSAPPLARRLRAETLDIPWHLALDRTHEVLQQIEED